MADENKDSGESTDSKDTDEDRDLPEFRRLSAGSESPESRFAPKETLAPLSGEDGESAANRRLNGAGSIQSRLEGAEKQLGIVIRELEESDLIGLGDIAFLMRQGLTAQEAVDYIAVEKLDFGYAEWGRETGDRSRQTVFKTVKRAEAKLSDDEEN
jgi:hypothetical protein